MKHAGNSLAKVIAAWPKEKVDRFKAEMKRMEERGVVTVANKTNFPASGKWCCTDKQLQKTLNVQK